MVKISVVSPSNRADGLDIVKKCLKNQTFKDYEWLIDHDTIKGKNDFYSLNKAWNRLFTRAQGELIVSIVDYTEFEPSVLAKLWNHYTTNPTMLVSGVGFQFEGEKLVWQDPRIENKGIHAIAPIDMEFRLASIPRAAIYAVGGIDEEYDTVVANSEKELCMRIQSLGYHCLLDESLVYRFFKHAPHGEIWDKLYIKSVALLNEHWNQILIGTRLKLNYVNWT